MSSVAELKARMDRLGHHYDVETRYGNGESIRKAWEKYAEAREVYEKAAGIERPAVEYARLREWGRVCISYDPWSPVMFVLKHVMGWKWAHDKLWRWRVSVFLRETAQER